MFYILKISSFACSQDRNSLGKKKSWNPVKTNSSHPTMPQPFQYADQLYLPIFQICWVSLWWCAWNWVG